MSKTSTLINKIFKDKHGRIVLGQFPNAPLIIWGICIVLQKLSLSNDVSKATSVIGFCALIVWAIMELGWGVNYFRRILGLIVLFISIASRFR